MKPTGLLLFSLLIFFLYSDVVFGAEPTQGDREKRFTSWADTYYKIDCSIFNSNNCPRLYQPVCGSDGKTYDNLCVFCNTILRSNGSLVLRYLGECY
ncbi:ovomucoid-like isoform X10 [Hemicordylus capensis]|uniref:ovomucoid-like isoform X10 n=1 Tax=Hemicordylus capensis TaxID=884348 RepID=UPI0023032349|nr:ovomucoid-like isoform X10 [Hemicordylus capensis]